MLAPDVKSAFRTLQVLEYFSENQKPARVSDIHRKLGAPQSSTSKLLGSLARRGYLEYDAATHTYFPTLRVTMLGNWLHERWFESHSLMAVASQLRREFGTSVILGVQNDTWAMYILALPALIRPRPPLTMGALRPLCITGVGKALLMLKSDADTTLLVRRINAEAGPDAVLISTKDLLADLHESRARGYAISHGELVPGTGVIAVPLAPIPHQPQMALGIGATLDVLDERRDEMVAVLKAKRDQLADKSAPLSRATSGTLPAPR